jgi:hypothetical protein
MINGLLPNGLWPNDIWPYGIWPNGLWPNGLRHVNIKRDDANKKKVINQIENILYWNQNFVVGKSQFLESEFGELKC